MGQCNGPEIDDAIDVRQCSILTSFPGGGLCLHALVSFLPPSDYSSSSVSVDAAAHTSVSS